LAERAPPPFSHLSATLFNALNMPFMFLASLIDVSVTASLRPLPEDLLEKVLHRDPRLPLPHLSAILPLSRAGSHRVPRQGIYWVSGFFRTGCLNLFFVNHF
jgi:hypothetical protein